MKEQVNLTVASASFYIGASPVLAGSIIFAIVLVMLVTLPAGTLPAGTLPAAQAAGVKIVPALQYE